MFDVFAVIRRLLNIDRIKIDNMIFSLHYKVTMVLLVICSVLVTKRQYFGDPIVCISSFTSTIMINTYCWIQSTFTVPALTGAVVGEEVAHPGVAYNDTVGQEEPHQIRHHKYYQWVTLFLFLQAGMFYLPRYIWKRLEGGRVRSLVEDLNLPIVRHGLKQERVTLVVNYFANNFHHHDLYAFQFIVCELLNFVNVVGQIFFTDRFLGYGFLMYGPRVMEDAQLESGTGLDPTMEEIFPKVAKCTFHKYGASGSIESHDILCVLPLNILNEKIFLFLWFWFFVVAAVTAFGLLYRLATFVPGFRHLLLRGRSHLASEDKVEAISRKCRIGDWFMLFLLAKNMDPFAYKDFINDLMPRLVEKEHLS